MSDNEGVETIPWGELKNFFTLLGQAVRESGVRSFPPYDTLPSQEIDEVCDIWCEACAVNPGEFPAIPQEIGPWILARVISAGVIASSCERENDKTPGKFGYQIVRHLLIKEWHGGMRGRWKLTGDLPDYFDYQPPPS